MALTWEDVVHSTDFPDNLRQMDVEKFVTFPSEAQEMILKTALGKSGLVEETMLSIVSDKENQGVR